MKTIQLQFSFLSLLIAVSCGPDALNQLNKAPVNQLNKSSTSVDSNPSATGTVAPPDSDGNCTCPYNYAPVCGSDGMTYGNSCTAKCNSISSYTSGECPKANESDVDETASCVCTLQYMPVCGNDGNTYGNSCVAKCNKITSYTQGVCAKPTVDACICPLIYSPVCGSNKQNYSNSCLAKCDNITSYKVGKCDSIESLPSNFLCKCPALYSPVCGSEKKTSASTCMAKCNEITFTTKGICLELFYPKKLPLEIEDIKVKIPVMAIPIKWFISK